MPPASFAGPDNWRYYCCHHPHPISKRSIRANDYESIRRQRSTLLDSCLLNRCPMPFCGIRFGHISEEAVRITLLNIDAVLAEEFSSGRHVQPHVIRNQVENHVHVEPAAQQKRIVKHHNQAPQKVIKRQVEKHIYKQPIVETEQIIENHFQPLQPQIIKQEINHVYIPEPEQRTETKTYVHQGGRVREVSSIQEAQEYAESSSRQTSKHVEHRTEHATHHSDITGWNSAAEFQKAKERMKEQHPSTGQDVRKGKEKMKEQPTHTSPQSTRQQSSTFHQQSSTFHQQSSTSHQRSSHRTTRQESQHRSSTKQAPETEPHPWTYISSDEDEDNAHHASSTTPSSTRLIEPVPPTPSPPAKPTPLFDPYAALGLDSTRSTADATDIAAAYKGLMRTWHPDRHVGKTQEEQDKATRRTAEINRANDILGDEGRRRAYDRTGKTEIWMLEQEMKKEGMGAGVVVRAGEGKQEEGVKEERKKEGKGKGDKGLKDFFKKKR